MSTTVDIDEEALRHIAGARLNSIAREIEKTAKYDCPKRTGALAASIHIEEVDESHYVVSTGAEIHYAEYVEYGTSKMTAKPFMRTACLKAGGTVS